MNTAEADLHEFGWFYWPKQRLPPVEKLVEVILATSDCTSLWGETDHYRLRSSHVNYTLKKDCSDFFI